MDSDLLRAFLETADAGALSRAARRMGLSQPSLTGQIQRLEAHLGVVLFRRHGRGVALTEAGEVLVPRAKRLLEELRATEAMLRGDGGGDGGDPDAVRGTVRLGVIPTVAPYVMPEVLRRFRARHGAARVELREDYSAVLAEQLHEGVLDVVIAAQPYAFDVFDVEPLGTDALLVAVPSTHPAARAGRITLAQLRESPAITLDPMHCLGAQVTGFCASREIEPSVVCRSAQLATVLALVGAGIGVSIVPALAATQHNTPQCVYVPLAEQELRRDIVAVWRRGSERRAGARAMVTCVREVVAANLRA